MPRETRTHTRIMYGLHGIREHAAFFLWRRVETLDRLSIERWQERRLRSIVREAKAHVPMYRTEWKGIHKTLSEARPDKLLHTIPLLPKETVKSYTTNQRLHDQYREKEGLTWVYTSGSTGHPLHIAYPPVGPASVLPPYEDVQSWRFLLWSGKTIQEILRTPAVEININNVQTGPPMKYFSAAQVTEDPAPIFSYLKNHPETEAILSYNAVLLELARAKERSGIDVHVPYCVSYGGVLTQEQREYIERAFQCEVYDQYSTEEFYIIGTECRVHDGFHIHEESYIVETTGERGEPLPDGAWGSVVVTSLFNTAMPFIRYMVGDRGKIESAPCRCGLRTKRLFVEGRDGYYVTLGEKRFHYYWLISAVARHSSAVLQLQFHKTAPNELSVHIIPTASFTDAIRERIHADLLGLLGADISVRIALVDSVAQARTGKMALFVDHTAPSGGVVGSEAKDSA